MTNVTINIQNNCGCGCGDSSGGGSGGAGIIDVPWEEIPSPTGPDGPPAGYIEASSLTDRQCRSAVFNYSWAYYLTDNLANTTVGQTFLWFASSEGTPALVKYIVASVLGPLITAVIAALITAGIEISDTVIGPITYVVSAGIYVYLTYLISTFGLTVASLQDTLTKLPAAKDNLICALAKAPDAAAAKTNLEQVVSTPAYGFTTAQQNWIIGICATMAPLLYYTPEWWPSFDTETLASISPNCCGTFVEGSLIGPGSDEGCQTAWYIVDQLVAALNGVQSFYSKYTSLGFGPNWFPFDDDTIEIVEILQANVADYIPAKVLSKAPNPGGFYDGVAGYINVQTFGKPWLWVADSNWGNLGAYLSSQAATIRTGLRNALDVSDCYDAVSVPLFAWIDANVSDTDLRGHMKNGIDGLIKPLTGRPGILNLMFYQDADVAFYAVDDCTGAGGDPASYQASACGFDVAIANYDFTAAQYNWALNFSGNGSAQYVSGTGFKFTPAGWGLQSMELVQQVQHSVRQVRVTFAKAWGDGVIGHIFIYSSDDGQNWTLLSDVLYPYSPYTSGALCIDTKYIKIGANLTGDMPWWISKVEFLNS